MNNTNLSVENNGRNILLDRARAGLVISIIGILMILVGAKPEWVGLDRSPVVGFVQISVILVGLAVLCLGGNLSLTALWGNETKTILADIGLRLVSTGYVISVFSGMSDIFGVTLQQNSKAFFFGPWQAAGMEVGMLIIAAGLLMLVPYQILWGKEEIKR